MQFCHFLNAFWILVFAIVLKQILNKAKFECEANQNLQWKYFTHFPWTKMWFVFRSQNCGHFIVVWQWNIGDFSFWWSKNLQLSMCWHPVLLVMQLQWWTIAFWKMKFYKVFNLLVCVLLAPVRVSVVSWEWLHVSVVAIHSFSYDVGWHGT